MNHTQRVALLRRVLDAQESIWTVHYACAGFKHADHGPLSISCVCFRQLLTRAEVTFSQTDRKDAGEQYVLESFFDHIRNEKDAHFVHWNMNRSDYGFKALANRYLFVLGQSAPSEVPEGRQHDLDDLIGLTHGRDFAAHPKLHTLGLLNDFHYRAWLAGHEEARLFDEGKHGDIKRSCEEKARLLAFLAERFIRGRLITRHGGLRVSFAGETLDAVRVVTTLGQRALDVARQLRRRHANRSTLEVNDEYDWQDLLHALLRVFFDDIRREDPSPTNAGASSRIDFVLPEHRIAIELKHARESMTAKSLGDELSVDRQRYEAHPQVAHLVSLILDPKGLISNPRGLERDLSTASARSGLSSTVRIYDR
ncbi:MAG: hypothetical protein AAGF11_47280 [Myxococcota bacterium]